MPSSSDVLRARFRANPAFELVPFDGLNEVDRPMVDDLARDPAFFGILRPRAPGAHGIKTATHELAALVRGLTAARQLPPRLRGSRDAALPDEIARLVLDGVLEIEHERRFVSGVHAAHLLHAVPAGADDSHPIRRLSEAALAYGEALEIDDAAALSARLYFYNRIPATPRWATRLATATATLDFLGLRDGETRVLLEQHWSLRSKDDASGWLQWVPRQLSSRRGERSATHKLYVSPAIERLPDVVRNVVRVLAAHDAPQFKIGSDVHGLLRPDKIVVYFDDAGHLDRVAAQLRGLLAGVPAHGVPFTAPIDDTGVLSRGMDPPETEKLLSWRETESWRLWTTNRLAVYLRAAKSAGSESTGISPSAFALGRIRLDGVDTRDWTPIGAPWTNTELPLA